MTENSLILPALSPVNGLDIQARFDGGSLSSDGGVLVLREIEKDVEIADALAACLRDKRDPQRTLHSPNYSSGLAALPSASGIGRVYGGDLIWILCRRLGLIFWVEGRLLPRRLRALCPDTGGEQDEHFLVWTGRWECDADPCLQLFDTDSDLQEGAAYGFECCAAHS